MNKYEKGAHCKVVRVQSSRIVS